MEARIAWVLNLDADLELCAGSGYQPRKGVVLAMRDHAQRLAATLLGPGDILIPNETREPVARGFRGRAFCPTPSAVRLLERAGAEPEPHPSVAVLQRVNSRAFASALGRTLPSASFVTELAAALALLTQEPPLGRAWRVKHAFGMAGRNQRVMIPARSDSSDLAFLRGGVSRGGLQIEPDVSIEEEYAVHGFIRRDGTLRTGTLVRQYSDERGVWTVSERIAPEAAAGLPELFSAGYDESGSAGEPRSRAYAVPGVSAPERPCDTTRKSALEDVSQRMADEIRYVGTALFGAGYFGPFGIDAYTYRDGAGLLRLQPRSEINARYTMGFALGFRGHTASIA